MTDENKQALDFINKYPLPKEIDETIRAALSEQQGWQPIESAPCDGTNILLLDESGEITVGWFELPLGIVLDAFSTTHWMPLPTPPNKETK